MKPEEVIEEYLRKRAEALGFLCYKFTSPGNSGVPDRVLIGYGKTFFIETKAPGEKPRKLQERVIERINSHGGLAFVTDSKDGIDTILETIIRQENDRNEKMTEKVSSEHVSGKAINLCRKKTDG